MATMKIKKGDTVKIIAGKDKDKEGKVLVVNAKDNTVIVEGANMQTKHVKPRRQGETGGIVKAEAPINACKVSIYCPKCEKGAKIHDKIVDGKKVRTCAKCGYKFD